MLEPGSPWPATAIPGGRPTDGPAGLHRAAERHPVRRHGGAAGAREGGRQRRRPKFWTAVGFAPTRETRPWRQGRVVSEVVAMDKTV
jgi:hypothetical protein